MVRLPVPGSDNGTWGDVLNEFLTVAHNNDGTLKAASTISGAVQSSTVTAKGDLLVAGGASNLARLPVGGNGTVLTADSAQSGGVKWAVPAVPAGGISTYPLGAYGLIAATDDLLLFSGQYELSQAFIVRLFVPANTTITAIGTVVRNAGTAAAGGTNGFAIYDNSGALVTSTPNDNSMWTTMGWVFKTLGTPIAAQTADRFVYVGVSCQGYSPGPYIPFRDVQTAIVDGGGYNVTHRRSIYVPGAFTWPASFNPQTYGQSSSGSIPLVALA